MFLLAKNLAIGGVSAIVMGTRTGIRALLQSKAKVKAPPAEAAICAVRFLTDTAVESVSELGLGLGVGLGFSSDEAAPK
jgi:hypothetical protein